MLMHFVLICLVFDVVFTENISVQTTNAGNIKGKIQTVNGKSYGVYLGIPYAKPPLDNLRFKEPQPLDPKSSETVVDASHGFSKKCIQATGYSDESQSEDCLYLNVMTPQTKDYDNAKLPVMVWIHGGGFIIGSASGYPVEGILGNLVSRGVIVVSINYRLGTFGFLTTRSSVAPGNYGLLDQVEALRWVQRNIQFFGGDPTSVTIFGESAGGAAVSFLTISPLTKGLFNQAIMMSGSALGTWVLMYDGEPNDLSGNVMEALNCRNKTTKRTNAICPYRDVPVTTPTADEQKRHEKEMECLLSKPAAEIAVQFESFFMKPRIDGIFLPESPEILIKKRSPRNIIMGVTAGETAILEFLQIPGLVTTVVQTEDEFKRSAVLIDCKSYKFPELVNFTTLYHYAHSSTPDKSGLDEKHFWFEQNLKFKSGEMFWGPAYKDAVEAINTNSTVFMYSYDWQNAIDYFDQKTNFYWQGAGHAAELFSLFDAPVIDMLVREGNHTRRDKSHDKKASEVWGKLFTNFAKFGNPTPDASIDNVTWQPFTIKDSNYLSIDMPKIRMAKKFYEDDVELWNRFIPALEESVQCK